MSDPNGSDGCGCLVAGGLLMAATGCLVVLYILGKLLWKFITW